MHGIPFNMVDLPLAGEYRVIEAVLMLLTLPLGQFTRPEMLKVLTHSAVRTVSGGKYGSLARLVSGAGNRPWRRSPGSSRHVHRP